MQFIRGFTGTDFVVGERKKVRCNARDLRSCVASGHFPALSTLLYTSRTVQLWFIMIECVDTPHFGFCYVMFSSQQRKSEEPHFVALYYTHIRTRFTHSLQLGVYPNSNSKRERQRKEKSSRRLAVTSQEKGEQKDFIQGNGEKRGEDRG